MHIYVIYNTVEWMKKKLEKGTAQEKKLHKKNLQQIREKVIKGKKIGKTRIAEN